MCWRSNEKIHSVQSITIDENMSDSCIVFLAKRVFELEKENSLLRVKLSTTLLDFTLDTQDKHERMKLLLNFLREMALEREKRKYETEQKSKDETKSTPTEVEKQTDKGNLVTCDCNCCDENDD